VSREDVGKQERCIWILMGRPEEKRSLGRSTLRWEDNIKVNFREMKFGDKCSMGFLRIARVGGRLLTR
jgi:hypothetical protein